MVSEKQQYIHGLKQFPELNEFETKGFVQASNKIKLLRILRLEYGDNFRIFKSGLRGCGHATSSKYGSRKIFGGARHYYYDLRRKEEFVKFLVEEFYKENPLKDARIKGEFTRLLHHHGLHWSECCK